MMVVVRSSGMKWCQWCLVVSVVFVLADGVGGVRAGGGGGI
jgi:hypothetical protein